MDERQEFLRKQVRRLTKSLGQALRNNDHKDADNIRQQRAEFASQLADECDEYFTIDENGRSHFVSIEEAKEHYSNPETKRRVGIANTISEMFQGRDHVRSQMTKFEGMSADRVKEHVLGELENQISRMEKIMNALRKEVGKDPIDFKAEDDKKDENSSFLDGIDFDSLL